MTWLYVPSPFAPGSADSTSASSEPSATGCELCVTLSGKPTRRPSSWPGWRSRPWMRLLCGTTSTPSTLARGAERWISSWRASRVSRGPSPGPDSEPRTNGGYGPASRRSSATWDPGTRSWRTSLVSLTDGAWVPFSADWPTSGSTRSGRLYVPRTWARPTAENDCSFWPTDDASVRTGFNRSPSPGSAFRPALAEMGAAWPTPQTSDSTGVVNEAAARLSHTPENSERAQLYRKVAVIWATPTSRDYKDASALTDKVPTNSLLGRQAPRSGIGGPGSSPGGPNSPRQWVTPSGADERGHATRSDGSELMPGQARRVSREGAARLNPAFVEWLMGLPIGWTAFAPSATRSSPPRPSEPSASSSTASEVGEA